MPAQLAIADTDERPDYIPEKIWPQIKRELALFKAGLSQHSLSEIAVSYGVKEGQLRTLFQSRKWRANIDEAREELATGARYAAQDLAAELNRRIMNGEHKDSKNLKFIDVVKAGKMAGEYMHDLTKSEPVNQSLNFYGANFSDVKMLIQNKVKPPEGE